MSKIYLKLKRKPKTIEELLLSLFSNGTVAKRTNVITYSDEKCLNIQCIEGKLRSFDEVYDIITTYFPETTLKEIIHNLITLDFKLDEPLYIKMTNCSTINRIVLYYSTDYFNTSIFDISKYNSKYCWDELLNLLKLKSIVDIKKYVKKHIKVKESISDKINNIEALKEQNKDFKTPYSLDTSCKLEKSLNATYILCKVAEIYNGGVTLDWNNINILKYLPYMCFSSGGGSGVSPSDAWGSGLAAPGFLFYKSPSLSEASYNNFRKYWEDYWGIN